MKPSMSCLIRTESHLSETFSWATRSRAAHRVGIIEHCFALPFSEATLL
jgi:hypothetical protein